MLKSHPKKKTLVHAATSRHEKRTRARYVNSDSSGANKIISIRFQPTSRSTLFWSTVMGDIWANTSLPAKSKASRSFAKKKDTKKTARDHLELSIDPWIFASGSRANEQVNNRQWRSDARNWTDRREKIKHLMTFNLKISAEAAMSLVTRAHGTCGLFQRLLLFCFFFVLFPRNHDFFACLALKSA